ncbi:MAG: M28 family peptidase [Gemmatimonadetes bacterium]|nr:M28 family peptidase [Gemmatimonadota bacterium]
MLTSFARISLAISVSPLALLAQAEPAPFSDAPVALPGIARTHTPLPTSPAITEEDLKTRLYIVADDSMEGREAGTRGGARANAYLVRELTRLGLTPAGDNGTFLQTIPLSIRAPDTTSTLRIDGVAGAARQFRDWVLVPRIGLQTFLGGQPYGGSFAGTSVPTVFGGRIGASAPLSPEDARGRVVVFVAPTGGNGRPAIAFWQRDNLLAYRDAAAVLVVGGIDAGVPAFFRYPRDSYDDRTRPAPTLTVLLGTRALAESIFGRPLDALAVGASGRSLSGRVGFVDQPTEAPAQNVVAILPGSDPALRREYVAVGSHIDHVGIGAALDHDSVRVANVIARPRGADDPPPTLTEVQRARVAAALDSVHHARPARVDSIANGADDDGSGAVIALELAESFANAPARPKRSLLFVWHTAEEKGLYGAQYYSDHPTVPRDSIVAQVNMDQMGRGGVEDAPPGGPDALVVIGARRLSTELGDLAESVNARSTTPFHFDYSFDKDGDPTNAYCRSDHYMYARFGIPVVFFSAAAWHIDYHMVSDEAQYIDYPRMARIATYVADLTRAIADLDHRPVVDKPKPDPDGTCRQ